MVKPRTSKTCTTSNMVDAYIVKRVGMIFSLTLLIVIGAILILQYLSVINLQSGYYFLLLGFFIGGMILSIIGTVLIAQCFKSNEKI